jgi:two-component system cell cycle sensor histidine kinase/response regulator CckA
VNQQPPTFKQSILVIDDDRATLTLVGAVLTAAGYNVVKAQSGFEALDKLRLQPYEFQLAILDLTMPLMDGEETFRRMREIRPDLPVILETGFIQQDKLEQLYTIGLAGFLRKPVAPDEIITTVRATLDSVKYSGGAFDAGRSAAL